MPMKSGAEQSKIVSTLPKRGAIPRIYQKALTDLFSGRGKFSISEDWRNGLSSLQIGRREEAKISLSVAKDLEKPLNPIQPDPFLFNW